MDESFSCILEKNVIVMTDDIGLNNDDDNEYKIPNRQEDKQKLKISTSTLPTYFLLLHI